MHRLSLYLCTEYDCLIPHRFTLYLRRHSYSEGTFFVFRGLSFRRIRRRVQSLSSASQLAEKLGVDAGTATCLAVDKGIMPRCILNGENLYDLRDFSDFNTLLRASTEPSAPVETLLRPAGHTDTTPPDQLLRSAVTDEVNRTISRRNKDTPMGIQHEHEPICTDRKPHPGRRMTWQEFHDWSDERTHAEWIDGEVILLPPATDPHQMLVPSLISLLTFYVAKTDAGSIRTGPSQIKLARSAHEPDVMFIAKQNEHRMQRTFLDARPTSPLKSIAARRRIRPGQKVPAVRGQRRARILAVQPGQADGGVLSPPRRRQVSPRTLGTGNLSQRGLTGVLAKKPIGSGCAARPYPRNRKGDRSDLRHQARKDFCMKLPRIPSLKFYHAKIDALRLGLPVRLQSASRAKGGEARRSGQFHNLELFR